LKQGGQKGPQSVHVIILVLVLVALEVLFVF